MTRSLRGATGPVVANLAVANLAALALLVAGCALPQADTGPGDDPSRAEVSLPCEAADWRAFLVFDNGETGIWTVKPFPVFNMFGCPELVGLDDLGRCWILVSYSGKWTPFQTIEEKAWLGALAHGDVDPRFAGAELYVGGKKGNLYQIVAHGGGVTDHRLIADFPGRELHTVLAGELDPRSSGPELLAFTRPGGLYRVTPSGPDGTFVTELLQELTGRVRDAALLPSGEIATVSRAGRLDLLLIEADGPRWTTVYETAMGLGRVAVAPFSTVERTVLYATRDDGVVLRFELGASRRWEREEIYLGPRGPRGLASGRFCEEPDVESVAVFGYSGRVQLLTRAPGEEWSVETIFEDRDKGHWLSVVETDGRNSTDELVGSGYGGRIFLLSRPPGYGRGDTPTDDYP